jgi:hypothetical protein
MRADAHMVLGAVLTLLSGQAEAAASPFGAALEPYEQKGHIGARRAEVALSKLGANK